MFKITEADRPDIAGMKKEVEDMARRGIRVADLTSYVTQYNNLLSGICKDIQEKYEIDNPNSPAQIVSYISNLSDSVELGSKNDIINICYDSKTGKWTSKAEALEQLAGLGYEFAQDILDYRHVKELAKSINGLKEHSDCNNLVHPVVSLTKTNRISYSEPALMSIPKKLLWSVIVPYKEGDKLYSVDIKNQEPHILINLTGAKELQYALESEEGLYEVMFKQCFKQTVTAHVIVDSLPENRRYSSNELRELGTISPAYYTSVKPFLTRMYYKGQQVVGVETVCIGSEKGVKPDLPSTVDIELKDGSIEAVPVKWGDYSKKYKRNNDYEVEGEIEGIEIEVGKAERKEFKSSYLAISYGSSIMGVREICKLIDGDKVYKYITQIKPIKEYRAMISKLASAGETSIKTIFGTIVNAEVDAFETSRLKRVLLDLPIQGSAADILSLLIKHFNEEVSNRGLADKLMIYYTRHDELIIEVNREYYKEVGAKEIEETLRDILEHQYKDWIPFKIEVEELTKEEGDSKINQEDIDGIIEEE